MNPRNRGLLILAPALLAATVATGHANAPATAAPALDPPGTTMIRLSELPGGLEFGCSAGFGGRDRSGMQLVVTARHCGPERRSIPAYLGDSHLPDGWLVPSTVLAGNLDYSVVRLRPGRAVRSDPLAGPPAVGSTVCKTGRMSGTTCGPVLAVTPTAIIARVKVVWGDSGSPLRDARGRIIAITSRVDSARMPADQRRAFQQFVGSMTGTSRTVAALFVRADAILADLRSTIGFRANH